MQHVILNPLTELTQGLLLAPDKNRADNTLECENIETYASKIAISKRRLGMRCHAMFRFGKTCDWNAQGTFVTYCRRSSESLVTKCDIEEELFLAG